MSDSVCIYWFRQDLRLQYNQALNMCLDRGLKILPIYILDEVIAKGPQGEPWLMEGQGGASKVYLYHSLSHLKKSLSGHLSIYKSSCNGKDLITDT